MSISRGDVYVFYSSIRVCLREISKLVESGRVTQQDLSATTAELSAMKAVLERSETANRV